MGGPSDVVGRDPTGSDVLEVLKVAALEGGARTGSPIDPFSDPELSSRMVAGLLGEPFGVGVLLPLRSSVISRYVGSNVRPVGVGWPVERLAGLEAGDITGEVCSPSGTLAEVSNTKKASPPSPSFMA